MFCHVGMFHTVFHQTHRESVLLLRHVSVRDKPKERQRQNFIQYTIKVNVYKIILLRNKYLYFVINPGPAAPEYAVPLQTV